MKTFRINSFEDLVRVLEENDLTISQMNTITSKAVDGICVLAETKGQFINALVDYWQKYGDKPKSDRPIFIDVGFSEQRGFLDKIIESL